MPKARKQQRMSGAQAKPKRRRNTFNVAKALTKIHRDIGELATELNGNNGRLGWSVCPTNKHAYTFVGPNIWLKDDRDFGKPYTFCKVHRKAKACHYVFQDQRLSGFELAQHPRMIPLLQEQQRLLDLRMESRRIHHSSDLQQPNNLMLQSVVPPTSPPSTPIHRRHSGRPALFPLYNSSPLPTRSPGPRFLRGSSPGPLIEGSSSHNGEDSNIIVISDSDDDENVVVISDTDDDEENVVAISDTDVDSSVSVTVIIHSSAIQPQPCKVNLHPIDGLVLRQHKILLGSFGLEAGDAIQMFTTNNEWKDVRWSESIDIRPGGFIRLKPRDLYTIM
ncbi:hypothetical protein EV361DRAFT_101034 [Lentinula raphanica]|nr:hypothetical protein EV361DRAFT_101034 [Lentinula raphanica]